MNNSSTFNILGIMSGTSLDGVDLAHCELTYKDNKWHYIIKEAKTVPYSKEWKNCLIDAFNFNKKDLSNLNIAYGNLLSMIIELETKGWNYDYIASHGHTILHQPKKGITIQVGDGQTIANKSKKTTIYDFRTQDVKLGGQGAPLVPIGDKLLFGNFDYRINLGGFANISFEKQGITYAYDICPVNFVINEIAIKLGKPYDHNGDFARSGQLLPSLLNKLNQLDFYNTVYPKSLGREWVETHIKPILHNYKNAVDILRTFTEHVAIQVSNNLVGSSKSALFTGGGVYNTFLMERIKCHNPKINFQQSDKETIEFKEALIFAFLGVLKLRNEINTLCSVTGASMDHSSGKVVTPMNV